MAKTTKTQVWNYIKTLGATFTRNQVMEKYGLERTAARWHFKHIEDRGGIRKAGSKKSGPYVRWEVVNPRVKIEDERGAHPNSLANLKHVMDRAGTRARTDRDKCPNTWSRATELDKCWGLRSDSLDSIGRRLSNSRREGASNEIAPEAR